MIMQPTFPSPFLNYTTYTHKSENGISLEPKSSKAELAVFHSHSICHFSLAFVVMKKVRAEFG